MEVGGLVRVMTFPLSFRHRPHHPHPSCSLFLPCEQLLTVGVGGAVIVVVVVVVVVHAPGSSSIVPSWHRSGSFLPPLPPCLCCCHPILILCCPFVPVPLLPVSPHKQLLTAVDGGAAVVW